MNVKDTQKLTPGQVKDAGMALALLCLLAGVTWNVRSLQWAAMAVLLADMILPRIFKPFAVLWFGLSTLLGNVMSKVLLTALFFVVVTPIAMLRRLIGHDPLRLRRWRRGSESIFTVRNHLYTAEDIERPY